MKSSLFTQLVARLSGSQAAEPVESSALQNPTAADLTATSVAARQLAGDAEMPQDTVVLFDEDLLEQASTQWKFGDWQSLAQLSRDRFDHHPDRAKLALFAAAGRFQMGQQSEAKTYVRLAEDWGVNRGLVSQILVSGVYNSLGRAAAYADRRHQSAKHFAKAIRSGLPRGAEALVTNARAKHELATLGLLPGGQGHLQQRLALQGLAKEPSEPPKLSTETCRPAGDALSVYINLGQSRQGGSTPFLLIDSKSLPRSGLHYLKNSLGKVFGEDFSFCEWYQEMGCCKQMPCALTGFATHANETRQLRIRLIKSHDFDKADPVYETSLHLRRLILVRDPIYVLTSWFALDQLQANQQALAKNGINTQKIFLAHEREVLKPAYRIVNEHFDPPSISQLTEWLNKKSIYISAFVEKWLEPNVGKNENYLRIVRYEDINAYILDLINELKVYMPDTEVQLLYEAETRLQKQFIRRDDPFNLPSKELTNYVRSNSLLFLELANRLSELKGFAYALKQNPNDHLRI